ncbi:hypothetical protein M422DRAFT_248672 [Sphaerobolus stellatus SS14]|nr:hypothetical protein M422DRAFT_248672 [Sphaerobolus stellatus SS14]
MPIHSSPTFRSTSEAGVTSQAIGRGSSLVQLKLEVVKTVSVGNTESEEIILPMELLGEIFKWLVAMTDQESPTTPWSAPFVFTQVSRFWRSVAFSLHDLWEYLGIGPGSPFNIYQVLAMYLAHCSPSSTLRILAFPPIPDWNRQTQDIPCLSRVQSMWTNAVNIMANQGVILVSIDTIVLDISVASYEALAQFLGNCSMLKELRIIVGSVDSFQGSNSFRHRDALLPHRHQLELKLPSNLDSFHLFNSFNAPNLSYFRLTLTGNEGGNPQLWFGLVYLFETSKCLETLVLQNVKLPGEGVPALIMTSLMKLNTLFIMGGAMSRLLDILSRTHHSEWICPELSYLHLTNVPVIQDELLRLVNARRAQDGVTGITNILLRGCKGISTGNLMENEAIAAIEQVDIIEALPECDDSWIEDHWEFEGNNEGVELAHNEVVY